MLLFPLLFGSGIANAHKIRATTERVFANACERCTNVLLHKYLNGADGYEEYSEEWKKANTVCDWCRDEEK